MSRNRTPLAMQKGHLKVVDQNDKIMEESLVKVGSDQLSKPPPWLVDAVARKEYKRIVEVLSEIDIVGNLDLNNIGCYCNAYSFYRQATSELKGAPLTVEKFMQNGQTTIVENPLINIQKKYAEEMRKFASMCGMSIDSRLKAATIKTTRTQQNINSRFGDI